METIFPVGKLPAKQLAFILAKAPVNDPQVLLGPGLGLDCAVVDMGDRCLVYKSDPITFATDQIGWYAVQVNVNDVATTGATPRWLLATLLLPEGKTTLTLVEQITQQLYQACREIGVAVIGGHTEITYNLDRPVLVATLIGEVDRRQLVLPQGAGVGDRILLTKGVPIEATAILAREFPERLGRLLGDEGLSQAQAYLHQPGISILRDVQVARQAGCVTAMHDPTEGGIMTALWELCEASGQALYVDLEAVPVPSLAKRVCRVFDLNPLAAIASGALLLTVRVKDSRSIQKALEQEGLTCVEIGVVENGVATVWTKTDRGRQRLPRPTRDEIARVYEKLAC